MILLISYDLLGPERPQSYEAVRDAIVAEAGEENYVKALYSQFLVDTTTTVDRWDDLLDSLTGTDDCWLICEITTNRAGTLNADAVSWLASHS